MTIHRTKQGEPPSGGPEAGRSIKQFGDVFVEWSGVEPDAAALAAHLNPPRPPVDPRIGAGNGALNRQEIEDLKAFLREKFA